ncbi:pentatricopeptide repeat-containing protein At1g62260, mitochondrial [Aristolochia californica]|uniref:pentatricopeptide repeat-containing protein At1g62260, mitochondrial n=1 Tax=Aristolochia californica TaxID=171875 RepID=UPI0035E35217
MGAFAPSLVAYVRRAQSQSSFQVIPDFRKWNKNLSQLIQNGQLMKARCMFDQMSQRNVVTWNSMISGYLRNGEIVSARRLFDDMPERNVVSWNLMMSGYADSRSTRQLLEGRRLFDQMPERDSVSWNTMISGYARNKKMVEAVKLFDQMPVKNVISWNAMITGFLQNGDVHSAIKMFERMPVRDSASVSTIVSGLIGNGKLDEATEFLHKHGKDGQLGDALDAYNTLIAGYGQNGRVKEARRLFDQIPAGLSLMKEDTSKTNTGCQKLKFTRNLISWNSMIMCYVKAGDTGSAQQLFDEMPERDAVSWNTMINAYIQEGQLDKAVSLFNEMPNRDSRSWNFMISGYALKGELEIARDFFNRMPQKSLVSWNSIIAGYEQNGLYEASIELFIQMQEFGEKPDRHTLSSILSACAGLGGLYQGMQIHQLVTKTLSADIPINNSIITMYARCGNIRDAMAIFDDMKTRRDVVSWNAMIGGYARHGFAGEALDLFQEMKRMKVKPTYLTFVSVLHACDHAGLVTEGRMHFDSMVNEFGIAPRVEHFASLVDVIGRHGNLEEALQLIKCMPMEPDSTVWGALLGACRVHKNVDMACIAAEELMRLEPESSAPYVLLHNMHVDFGRWEDAKQVRRKMEKNGIRKQCGYSWIELHDRVHLFASGDCDHPDAEGIHALAENLNKVIKDLGFEIFQSVFDY